MAESRYKRLVTLHQAKLSQLSLQHDVPMVQSAAGVHGMFHEDNLEKTLLEKRFSPSWLAGTSVGELMFQADYYLKELAMGEHLGNRLVGGQHLGASNCVMPFAFSGTLCQFLA